MNKGANKYRWSVDTMKEVLTEDASNVILSSKKEFKSWLERGVWNCRKLDEVSRKLFDYEEKEEKGLLLELPCKIGEKVYFIDEEWKYKDEEFDVVLVIKKIPFSYSMIPFVGTSYYLTKEEAEVALNNINIQ